MESVEGPPPRVGALSLPGRIVVAVTLGAVTVGALYHLGMVFLHVAPSNTLSKEHGSAVSHYIYPEFEQHWQLFAPEPLQQNIHVEARAEIRAPGGATRTTGWVDFTGADVAAMRHNPIPSHTQQNELRRAWGYYTDNHDTSEQPTSGDSSDLSRRYLQQILQKRFAGRTGGGQLVRIQVRSATTQVAQPPWISGAPGPGAPQYRELPWWTVTPSGQENAS
jgi:hypothetical protein